MRAKHAPCTGEPLSPAGEHLVRCGWLVIWAASGNAHALQQARGDQPVGLTTEPYYGRPVLRIEGYTESEDGQIDAAAASPGVETRTTLWE